MKHAITFILFIFLALPVFSQTIEINQIEKTIDSIFKHFNNNHTPGVAVTLLQNGKVITKKEYGMANLEHSIPFTHKSPTRLIYSMGREFMSAGLAVMEAEGILRFDDRVRDYLPNLPQWSKDVTIQDLLNHQSGFVDEWSTLLLMHADMRNRVDKEQFLTLLYNQPKPEIAPGKGYMYCNTDFALLRFIMEMASKQNLPDYLSKKLFIPLGMPSTFMNDDIEAVIPEFATEYYGWKPYRKARFYKTSPGGNYRIVTTADDLEKWAMGIEDSTSILFKAFKRLYRDAKPIPVLSPEKHYVFGHEWQKRDTIEYVYHGGVDQGFYMFRIPSQAITVIGFGNSGNSIQPFIQLTESLLPKKHVLFEQPPTFPSTPILLDKKESEKFEGRYFEKNPKGYNSAVSRIVFYDIKQEGDNLNFYYNATESLPLTAFGNNLFKDLEEDVPMQFTTGQTDAATMFKVWLPDGEVKTYQKLESTVKVNKEYLQQFTGRFYSPHLDYFFRIILNDNGQLVIKRPTVGDKIMEPYEENRFFFEGETGGYSFYTTITFTKNKKNQIDGYTLQGSRLMQHQFVKVNK